MIRRVQRSDLDVINELAVRSKAYWGYSEVFMRACKEELTQTASLLASENTLMFCACDCDVIAGFYCVTQSAPGEAELSALFVEPDLIGKGVGNRLLTHALQQAKDSGWLRILTQSDPNAEAFYTRMGAVTIDQRESESIPGRFLPLMEFSLT